ncbi:hypothetical protein CF54_31010 [Streptomyces sp. F-3]|jgi:hypothetical protein|uniref:hypothetical protein n=1 Tax=unclassified Streptomyces TaxID=2593676 RepID=UPI0007C2F82E|nr:MULTISPECIES: hypothetical protein [unclassified Streptomyces]MDN5383144.1 hypothetical protein [Streptomyces sp. LB8]GAT80696.1 hypothetical protein CF54_31010 [Streptomyces sp. F-3]
MWKRRKRARPDRPLPSELCDLCGAVFPRSEAVRGRVADSSAVHPTDVWADGLRRVVACCEEHLEAIRKEYEGRAFVPEELWAAKIDRALSGGTQSLTMGQLGCRTGLQESQIRRAIAWHNAHLRQRPEP